MDADICKKFQDLRNSLSDNLNASGSYEFTNEDDFKDYCTGNKCNDDTGKISAGCLYLLDAFFKDNSVFNSVAKSNINIVEYIIIWLSYMIIIYTAFNFLKDNDQNIRYKYIPFLCLNIL
ncbi:hypothetical protein YYC_05084 [Plasmodium yoelii 17X]|uniref:Uncharacterized protein n=1 Tax=Plasmodium yoelii 17X TaxID=1323249 RepID=V7PG17_PLAYE|nr:hypothetical protein YYC_05084 [Plasmodium yoelii 17X]